MRAGVRAREEATPGPPPLASPFILTVLPGELSRWEGKNGKRGEKDKIEKPQQKRWRRFPSQELHGRATRLRETIKSSGFLQ